MMPIVWNLKKWLAVERDIYRPTELQALLAERVGVRLSLQAVSTLVNGKPHALRLQTVQALCDALDCKLSDFCDVTPNPNAAANKGERKVAGASASRLYGGKKSVEEDGKAFPDPHKYKT